MALRIRREHLDQIIAHARQAAPEECCGIFIGRRQGIDLDVLCIVASANVWDPDVAPPASERRDRTSRFLLDPLTHLKAQRGAREAGLDVIGFYHSHPHSPPAPSQFDRDMAWPDHAYLIISLLSDPPEIRIWRIQDENAPFSPESMLIDPSNLPEV